MANYKYNGVNYSKMYSTDEEARKAWIEAIRKKPTIDCKIESPQGIRVPKSTVKKKKNSVLIIKKVLIGLAISTGAIVIAKNGHEFIKTSIEQQHQTNEYYKEILEKYKTACDNIVIQNTSSGVNALYYGTDQNNKLVEPKIINIENANKIICERLETEFGVTDPILKNYLANVLLKHCGLNTDANKQTPKEKQECQEKLEKILNSGINKGKR